MKGVVSGNGLSGNYVPRGARVKLCRALVAGSELEKGDEGAVETDDEDGVVQPPRNEKQASKQTRQHLAGRARERHCRKAVCSYQKAPMSIDMNGNGIKLPPFVKSLKGTETTILSISALYDRTLAKSSRPGLSGTD